MADVAGPGRALASTAHWTAAVRARESARDDRLFNDPWAGALAGREGIAWLEGRSPDSVVPMVLRTRFFDDFLRRVATAEGVRQIVLMAAGLDTRAFRLVWPEQTVLFELDQASLLEHKERTLGAAAAVPTCGRRRPTTPRAPAIMALAGLAVVANALLLVVPAERSVTRLAEEGVATGGLPAAYAGAYAVESVAGGLNVVLALLAMAAGVLRPGARPDSPRSAAPSS